MGFGIGDEKNFMFYKQSVRDILSKNESYFRQTLVWREYIY